MSSATLAPMPTTTSTMALGMTVSHRKNTVRRLRSPTSGQSHADRRVVTRVGVGGLERERRVRLAEEERVGDRPRLVADEHRDEPGQARRHLAGEQDGEPGDEGAHARHDLQHVEHEEVRDDEQPVDEGPPPGHLRGRLERERERVRDAAWGSMGPPSLVGSRERYVAEGQASRNGGQPELREELRVQEVVVAGELPAADLDHLQRPRLPAARPGRLVAPEAGGAVGLHRAGASSPRRRGPGPTIQPMTLSGPAATGRGAASRSRRRRGAARPARSCRSARRRRRSGPAAPRARDRRWSRARRPRASRAWPAPAGARCSPTPRSSRAGRPPRWPAT